MAWQSALTKAIPLLMGGESKTNPADAAMPYLDQIEGKMKPYYDPYVNAGTQGVSSAQGQYERLINDPTSVMTQIGQGYESSPGYEWNKSQATEAANRAASAGGTLGTPAHQQSMMEAVQGIASGDYWNYMNAGLGQYGTGLTGQQNMANLGYNAADSLGTSLGNALQTKAQLAYSGAANENQSQGGMWGGLSALDWF
jgi:hypothetical protein